MSESKGTALAYPRLCIAYFLQFAIWGSWAGFALSAYAGGVLKLPGLQIGLLFGAIPIGAMISPLFIGPLADRYFSAQKVVAFLHFLGGLTFLAAGYICRPEVAKTFSGDQFFYALYALIIFSGVCYMPTIALVNSIVFKHSREGSAPYVFVFGTFGWIVINLVIAALPIEQPYFFFVGAGCSILLALYALTLPDTPPKGAPKEGEKGDALGLGALKLFRDPSFAFFVICVFLASIPACNYFFAFQGIYLAQHGYPSAIVTLNQFSELFFMAMLPLFIARIGLKWVVVLGIGAWALRYYVFSIPFFGCAVTALLLHGFCYSFLYVAAYMYADKKAPDDLKASVQSLMAFLLLGVGQFLGALGYGIVQDLPQNAQPAVKLASAKEVGWVVAKTDDAGKEVQNKQGETVYELRFPAWEDKKLANSAWKYLDLGKVVKDMINPPKQGAEATVNDLGTALDKDGDNTITFAELDAAPDEIVLSGTPYKKADIEQVFKEIAAEVKSDSGVSRKDYLHVQAYNWKGILHYPAAYIAVFFVLFLIFGRDPDKKTKAEDAEYTGAP